MTRWPTSYILWSAPSTELLSPLGYPSGSRCCHSVVASCHTEGGEFPYWRWRVAHTKGNAWCLATRSSSTVVATRPQLTTNYNSARCLLTYTVLVSDTPPQLSPPRGS